MRFRAPARAQIDPSIWQRPIFADYLRWRGWLEAPQGPAVETLDDVARAHGSAVRVMVQDATLLGDGLHYEQRIAQQCCVATRADNWHDLFNALVWMRHPAIKHALNRRQVADLAQPAPHGRTRGQCALTHFDEAGVVLLLRERARIDAWDRHDWPALFIGLDGRDYALAVIGHALLEHALDADRLLCGKALVAHADDPHGDLPAALAAIAAGIDSARLLSDPQQLRPLPLMGLPGWHRDAGCAEFLRSAPCFQPLRDGRRYPPALRIATS